VICPGYELLFLGYLFCGINLDFCFDQCLIIGRSGKELVVLQLFTVALIV
jgi:hypothetical protein